MKDYSKEYRENIKSCKELDANDAKSELDSLFDEVRGYRTSKHYMELLNFCKKFKQLAPFNAMMVQIQRPSCQYVLTANQWAKTYNRYIVPNARPVVILSFKPVSYLYDISDTEPINDASTTTERILEEIKHQYDTQQEVSLPDLNMLIGNLAVLGIAFTDGFRAGAAYAAEIRYVDTPLDIRIPLNKKDYVNYKTHYLLSVNETLSIGARYASIMHELGHFFCHHLKPPVHRRWWDVRYLSHESVEFEAESVAWLLCERLNIGNPSARYLAGYVDKNLEIPDDISIDYIFKAHNEIWKLLFERKYAKDNFLYKTDMYFKEIVDHHKPGKNATIGHQSQMQLEFE